MTAARRTAKKRQVRRSSLRPKRRSKARHVPLGLRAIFEAMQTDAYRTFHGPTTPEAFCAIPAALLNPRAEAFNEALRAAADREFECPADDPAHDSVELMSISSFWAGVAACWYYTNAINGRDGGR